MVTKEGMDYGSWDKVSASIHRANLESFGYTVNDVHILAGYAYTAYCEHITLTFNPSHRDGVFKVYRCGEEHPIIAQDHIPEWSEVEEILGSD